MEEVNLAEESKLTVGQHLLRARERQGISLEAVAEVTRITRSNLEALERDKFHLLPAPLFVRGFLRTYAAHLGLDPGEMLSLYEAQIAPPPPPRKDSRDSPGRPGSRLGRILLLFSLLLLAAALAFQFFRDRSPLPPPSPPEGAQARPEAGPEPAKEAAPLPAVEKPAPAPPAQEGTGEEGRHILEMRATEKTWLRIQADDQPASDALLQPQETASWTARRRFKILIGNAGGVELFLDGHPQGRPGKSGQVIRLLLPDDRGRAGERKD
ncbi:MAG: DUF4115 domain-containing protein [Deltaproteobacteria bacterium]|nr:DUF4115 domain-containing protein [Deltaproteobacteria bacterium]